MMLISNTLQEKKLRNAIQPMPTSEQPSQGETTAEAFVSRRARNHVFGDTIKKVRRKQYSITSARYAESLYQ
jgi:hypothetical protein